MKRSTRAKPWSLMALTLIAISPAVTMAQATSPLPEMPASRALDQAGLDAVLRGKDLTLDEALKISLVASRTLRGALANYQKARAALGEAHSAFLPQISIGAQATEFDKPNVVDFGAMMGGPSLPVTVAHQWNPTVMASLGVQIDISGAIRSASSQAEYMALAARIDLDRIRNQLAFDVRSSYFQVIRAEGQVKVAQDNLAAAKGRLRDATLNETVGNLPKFDVISAERDVAEATQGVLAAKSQHYLSIASLKTVLGLDQSVKLTLAPLSDEPAPAQIAEGGDISFGTEYEAILAEARKQRPEILSAQAVIEAMKHGLRYASRSMLPSLSAGLGYTFVPNNGAFTPRQTTVASLTLNVPLFDGGMAREKVKQSEADKALAEVGLRGAMDQVSLEVHSAYVALEQAKARIRVADLGLAQAKEAYRLAQVRYSVGASKSSVVSPQLEVSSAQAALTQAATNRLNATIDLRQAQAALDYARGRFSPTR